MADFDRWTEKLSRGLARHTSRRSSLAWLGGLATGAAVIPALPVSRAAAAAPNADDKRPQDPGDPTFHRIDRIEVFGADRCMVSSNFPVEKAGVPYGVVWNMFKRIAAGCSDDEKRQLFGGTAKRIYRLPD